MKPSVGIVGCGRMGTALAKTLGDKGYAIVGVSSLHRTSAQRLADICGISVATDQPWEITRKADVVFLSTPDGVIESVCESISQRDGFSSAAVVLHCSGAHPSTILASARKFGASIGSMHPLQSFALVDRIARDLEELPLQILTEGKPLYHAAAVVASNFLVTLMGAAFRLIQQAGVKPDEAFSVLKPLVEGTLSNIDRVGIHQALTGPVVRGDVQTVETHIQAISQTLPELLPFYICLVHYTAMQAGEGNRISHELLKTFLDMSQTG